MTFVNPSVGNTASGTLTGGASATIRTQAQTASGVRIWGTLVGSATAAVTLSIGGSVTLTASPVTYTLEIPEMYVENEAIAVTSTGAGAGYYSISYEGI